MTVKAQIGDVEPRPHLYACRHRDCRGYGHSYSLAVAPGESLMTPAGLARVEGIQCPVCHRDMELIASVD